MLVGRRVGGGCGGWVGREGHLDGIRRKWNFRRPTPAHPGPPWAWRGRPEGPPRLPVSSWVLGPAELMDTICSALAGSSLGSNRKRLAGGPQAAQSRAILRVRTGPRPPRSPTILHGAVTQERAPDTHPFWFRPHAGSRLPLCTPSVRLHTLACGPQFLGPPPPWGALLSGLALLLGR